MPSSADTDTDELDDEIGSCFEVVAAVFEAGSAVAATFKLEEDELFMPPPPRDAHVEMPTSRSRFGRRTRTTGIGNARGAGVSDAEAAWEVIEKKLEEFKGVNREVDDATNKLVGRLLLDEADEEDDDKCVPLRKMHQVWDLRERWRGFVRSRC